MSTLQPIIDEFGVGKIINSLSLPTIEYKSVPINPYFIQTTKGLFILIEANDDQIIEVLPRDRSIFIEKIKKLLKIKNAILYEKKIIRIMRSFTVTTVHKRENRHWLFVV